MQRLFGSRRAQGGRRRTSERCSAQYTLADAAVWGQERNLKFSRLTRASKSGTRFVRTHEKGLIMGRPSIDLIAMSDAERQSKSAAKKRADGLRPVTVWVQDGMQERVRQFARSLSEDEKPREQHHTSEPRWTFPSKPPVSLRERMKRAGMRYEGEGNVWIGVPDDVEIISEIRFFGGHAI